MAQYADIVGITAPDEAVEGNIVSIAVQIKNTFSAPIGIKVVGVPEYEGLPPALYINFPIQSVNVNPGSTYSFSGSFVMPGKDVTIHVYSYWYGADDLWHLDDQMTKTVDLTEARYEFDIGVPAVGLA